MLQLLQKIQIEVTTMTYAAMERDARAFQRSLAKLGNEVIVPMTRETAEYLASITKAKALGHEV